MRIKKLYRFFFLGKGFKSTEYSFGTVQFNKKFREVRIEYSENQYNTKYEQVFDGYEASQTMIRLVKTKQLELR